MNISVSLTPELEELVRRKISSGRYHGAGDVVREALRRMEVHERLPKSLLSKSGAAGTAGCRETTTETPKPNFPIDGLSEVSPPAQIFDTKPTGRARLQIRRRFTRSLYGSCGAGARAAAAVKAMQFTRFTVAIVRNFSNSGSDLRGASSGRRCFVS